MTLVTGVSVGVASVAVTAGAVLWVRWRQGRRELDAERRRAVALAASHEAYLRKVHHRVKNDLQIICSLLDLQAGTAPPPTARSIQAWRRRVRTIGLVHEVLGDRDDGAGAVPMQPYLERLADGARRHAPAGVTISSQIAAVELPAADAVAVGLIAHELLANAVEHAFPEIGGTVLLALQQREGTVTLTVRDDGCGLPPGVDPAAPATLGLRLVGLLAGQLGTAPTVETVGGTCVTVMVSPGSGANAEVCS